MTSIEQKAIIGKVTPIKLSTINALNVSDDEANNEVHNINDFDGLNISHPLCIANVSLYGGQVLSFKPTGQKDLLWLSKTATYQNGKAIRGGIPLCWPWFGANDKQTSVIKSGNHGFARQLPWKVEDINVAEVGVTIVLVLTGENQDPLWPNAYKLTQTLFFGTTLKQTLSMTNLSNDNAQYSAALHTYFAVSSPENTSIETLTGAHYHDKLTDSKGFQQQNVSCVGEIDREYHLNKKMHIVDKQWHRKIEVISRHCQQWVLWNPGKALANKMDDIHSGGEQEFVCLEAANTSWQELPAGETVLIAQEISVVST